MPPEPAASTPDRSSGGSAALPWQSQAHANFVGRDAELQQLKSAFQATAGGQGALTLLVGEPGIGKTALCDELCRSVVAAGGLPLVGHCFEKGSFRRPYQPFVEAFGKYVWESDTGTLAAGLGSGASDLVCIVRQASKSSAKTPRAQKPRRLALSHASRPGHQLTDGPDSVPPPALTAEKA
jgi:hypothetical protein